MLADRYAIEREIGRGGMATVFLARDLRHDRPVALKVLLPELAAVVGSDRFLSEIRVTANLQHPHLLPLFDSGSADGLLFYTMPYVEGESLRARLVRERPMPIDEAVRIGVAVAGALDYAHRRGVIHRDLKPENILLLDGQPVVADFGIALAVAKAGGARVTETGISLGTPHYMSPEQATGDRQLDGRSDVYSLGCVVYEMLTGEVPHTGSSMQAVIARLLTDTPTNVRTLRPRVPEHVASAVMTALEKLPVDRWRSAQAFAAALERPPGAADRPTKSPVDTATVHPPVTTSAIRRRSTWRLIAVVGAVSTVAGTATWLWRNIPEPASSPPVRFTLVMPEGQRLIPSIPFVAMAPDAGAVVYAGPAARRLDERQTILQRPMLYYRPIGDLRARPIPATDGAVDATFSPDSRWLAFVTEGRLFKVPVSGGDRVTVLAGENTPGLTVLGATWGENGIVVTTRQGLVRVSADGGPPTRLTTTDTARGEVFHDEPRFFGDANTVAFKVRFKGDTAHTEVVSLDTRKRRLLPAPPGWDLVGMMDRLLVVARKGTVATVPFNVAGWRTMGEPLPVLDSVLSSRGVSITPRGSLAYVRGRSGNKLAIVDEHGGDAGGSDEEVPIISNPRFSPDGRRIALEAVFGTSLRGGQDVWVYDLTARVFSRVTTDAGSWTLTWSPNGRRIAYRAGRPAAKELWWISADGNGAQERLYTAPDGVELRAPTFSPDGKRLIFTAQPSMAPPRDAGAQRVKLTSADLWMISLPGDSAGRRAVPLIESPPNETDPRISPDGSWLAYTSDESGQPEVYVRAFPGLGDRIRVSAAGGAAPVWARDGRRLFYRENARLIAATLEPLVGPSRAASLSVVNRQPLFQGRVLLESGDEVSYDVHPDGKRFVVIRPAMDPEIVVVLNWVSELRERTGLPRR